MTETIINIITILVGSGLGILLKSKLPKRIIKTVFQALGLFTFALRIYNNFKN